MRVFPYITVGKLLDELNDELAQLGIINPSTGKPVKLTRPTFYRNEKRLRFPRGTKTPGGWRSYSREEADRIKSLLKGAYNISEGSEELQN